MTNFDLAVIGTNVVLAAVACVANFYAARHNPEPWRTVRVLVGSMALVYTFAYSWLLANSEKLVEWSQTGSGSV